MQTFLPYSNFKKSAECLDYRRLGKQRVEAWQIYQALTNRKYGWQNHPAVKMWRGYESSLLIYGYVICQEWINRGYNDTMCERFGKELVKVQGVNCPAEWKIVNPPWIGNNAFHASHRSNLLRKDLRYYSQFNWKEPDNLDYIWGNT